MVWNFWRQNPRVQERQVEPDAAGGADGRWAEEQELQRYTRDNSVRQQGVHGASCVSPSAVATAQYLLTARCPDSHRIWSPEQNLPGQNPVLLRQNPQCCRGYGYPWIYPCMDIRHRLPYYGYIHGYFYVIKFELSHHQFWIKVNSACHTIQPKPLLQVRTRPQCNMAISSGWVIFLRTCLHIQTKRRNLNRRRKNARSQLVRLY